MDATTFAAIGLVILVALVLAIPLYSSSRRTQKIEDPATRAAAERAEEDLRMMQRNHPETF